MPRIEKTISIGNVISIVMTMVTLFGMIAGGLIWSGSVGAKMDNLALEISRSPKKFEAHEIRIRSLETATARQDERMILILDSLRKIEGRLEAGPHP